MENDETIKDMFFTITKIVNGLKSLGKTYPSGDLVDKILDLFPSPGNLKSPPFKKRTI